MICQGMGEKEQGELKAEEGRMKTVHASILLYYAPEALPVPFLVRDKFMTLANLVDIANGHTKILRALHGGIDNAIYTVHMGGSTVEFDIKDDMDAASGLQIAALDGFDTKVVKILVRAAEAPAFAPPSPGKKRVRTEEEWQTA